MYLMGFDVGGFRYERDRDRLTVSRLEAGEAWPSPLEIGRAAARLTGIAVHVVLLEETRDVLTYTLLAA